MLKNKSIDYIFGMITGALLMLVFWAYTSDVTASGSAYIQLTPYEETPTYSITDYGVIRPPNQLCV